VTRAVRRLRAPPASGCDGSTRRPKRTEVETTREIGRRVAVNAAYLFTADVLGKLLHIVFVAFAARQLGVERYGMYGVITTVVFFLETAAQAGVRPMAVREIARNRDEAATLVRTVFLLLLGGATLAYVVLALVIPLLDYPGEVQALIFLLAVTLFPKVVLAVFTVVFYALEEMKTPSVLGIGFAVLSSSANILLLWLGYGLTALVWVSLLGSVGEAAVAGWLLVTRFQGGRSGIDVALCRRLIKESLPFAGIGLAMLAHDKADIFMLSVMQGPLDGLQAVGYYTPAYAILSALMIIPNNLRMAIVPAVAARPDSVEVMRSVLEGSTKVLCAFLSFPLIVATTFFAEEIVVLIFGAAYRPTAGALRILGLAYAVMAVTAPAMAIVSTSRNLARYVPWAVGVAAANVLLNLFLIPAYSFVGAAVATLITATAAWGFRLYVLRRMFGVALSDITPLAQLLPAMTVTFVVCGLLDWWDRLHPAALATGVALLYLAALVGFRAFRGEEIAMFRLPWRRWD